MIKKGYIIEEDRNGDSDNYLRYIIKTPSGTVVERGVYEYELNKILERMPDLSHLMSDPSEAPNKPVKKPTKKPAKPAKKPEQKRSSLI